MESVAGGASANWDRPDVLVDLQSPDSANDQATSLCKMRDLQSSSQWRLMVWAGRCI